MNASQQPQHPAPAAAIAEAPDYDLPYEFGRKLRSVAPGPFSTRQFARLLVLRSRVQCGQLAADDLAAS